jgi:predicted HAD superfamily hydrolase
MAIENVTVPGHAGARRWLWPFLTRRGATKEPRPDRGEGLPLLDDAPLRSASAAFMALLGDAEVVSFDIFDTLIARCVAEPTDIFEIMEREWALPGFAQERQRAEAAARTGAWESGRRPEVTLAEIYRATTLPADLEAALMAAEIELELACCQRNEAAYALYREAIGRGKRTIVVSDMYLPIDVVQKILGSNGIRGFERLYLSCDRMATKGNGELFDAVLANLGVEARRVLHVGDNPSSDVEVAGRKGIRAVRFPKVGELAVYDRGRAQRIERDPDQGMLRRTIWHAYAQAVADGAPGRGTEGFWYSIGFRLLGPGLIGFARMIRDGIERHRIERLYFLARDGAIVRQAFRALYPELADVCRYLVVSRRVLNVAALSTFGERELEFLMSGTSSKTCRQFLERVSIDADDLPAGLVSRMGLDLEQLIVSSEDRARLRRLFVSLREALLEIGARERAVLTRYLEEEGWDAGARVGIVDVGWHATLQRALEVLIARGDVSSVLVKGFYFGTYEKADKSVPACSRRVESFLFHYGEPKECVEAIQSCVEFHELLFSDVSFSATGMRLQDGQIVFSHAHSPVEEGRFEIIRCLRRGAMDAIRCLGPHFKDGRVGAGGLRQYYATYSREILDRPLPVEIRNIGSVEHAEGFEHRPYRALIVPPSGRGRRAYHRAEELSYWKKGFVSLYGPPR